MRSWISEILLRVAMITAEDWIKPPVYELRGNGLRVHFVALQGALIDQSKVPKDHPDTLDDPLADIDRILSQINKIIEIDSEDN